MRVSKSVSVSESYIINKLRISPARQTVNAAVQYMHISVFSAELDVWPRIKRTDYSLVLRTTMQFRVGGKPLFRDPLQLTDAGNALSIEYMSWNRPPGSLDPPPLLLPAGAWEGKEGRREGGKTKTYVYINTQTQTHP